MAGPADTPLVVGRVAYRPARHRGVRDSWTAATVLDALRLWVAETGAVPRRRDWTGERPGEAGAAQRKWMREHPRWPSSSRVAGHHGTWSAALEAAGLAPGVRVAARGAAERVAAAGRLRAAGLSRKAIADELGVSLSSVRNYLAARACPACGEPMTNPAAERCAACARDEPTVPRTWTREECRAALVDWLLEHGAAPTVAEWTPSRPAGARWRAASPRWPSAAVVCRLYASHDNPWNAVLRDAGLEPNLRRFNDDEVRQALAALWVANGRAPVTADLSSEAWTGPGARALRARYGGLAAAWRKLGPVPEN